MKSETATAEGAMNARAYDGMATVRGMNGTQYLIDYNVNDTDKEIMEKATRFYGVAMEKVEDR
jgi:hypothetical protein